MNAPPPAAPAAPAPAASSGSGGEGTYAMHSPDGRPVQIPYSKVHTQIQNGYLFQDQNTLKQYARDLAADPLAEDRVDQFLDAHPWIGAPVNGLLGAGTGVLKLVTGLDRTPTTRGETEAQLAAARPARGMGEAGGEMAENVAEFFGGDELLSLLGKGAAALPLAEKLKAMTGMAQLLEKYPPLAKLAKIGSTVVKQGTIAGGQTYVKSGGDTGAAAQTAAETAGVGGVIGAAGEGIASALAKRASGFEDVGGVKTVVPPEARTAAAPTPQQAAGQEVLRNSARGTLAGQLEEVNESRTEPGAAPALPGRTGPYVFELRGVPPEEGTTGRIGQSAAKVPQAAFKQPKYTAASAPTRTIPGNEGATGADIRTDVTPEAQADAAKGGGVVRTTDRDVAFSHFQNLNKRIASPDFERLPAARQQELLDAREDVRGQLNEHAEELQTAIGGGRPNLAQVDVPRATQLIGNHSETAAALKKVATNGYNHIYDALAFSGQSPQKLTMVRQAYQAAEAKYMAAETPEALHNAEQDIEATHEQLREMVKSIPNAISLKELAGLNDAYKNSLGLAKVGRAIDGAFTGTTSTAKRAWEYSGFDGNRLQGNLDRLIANMGRNRVERLMGKDNLDSVLQVAQLNRTNAARARFGQAITAIANSLAGPHLTGAGVGAYAGYRATHSWEGAALGAVGGATIGEASRRVMDAILTNPQVAQHVIFAIQSGANPKNYGPIVATVIQQANTQASQKRQAEEGGSQ